MSTQPNVEAVLTAIFEPFDTDPDMEMKRVLAMSRAEIRASLEARGNDLKALESRARAFLGVSKKKATVFGLATVIGFPTSMAAAVALAVQAFAPAANTPVLMTAVTAASPPPIVEQQKLRAEARGACMEQQWRTCLDKLDQAKAIDPGGETDDDIPQLRAQAVAGLKKGDKR